MTLKRRRRRGAGAFLLVAMLGLDLAFAGAAAAQPSQAIALDSAEAVEAHSVVASIAEHQGLRALRLIETEGPRGETVAIVKGAELLNGTIEIELAGRPREGVAENLRGFVGIAFRVQPDAKQFEAFYLRPTNGRADDQLRRNHSTQYISHPGYTWQKLRTESPGVYESYVDVVPGEWTKVRIEVEGARARLFVNGAKQPCLIVNDLKQSPAAGAVGLWIGLGTEAFFRNLRITPKAVQR